MMELRAGTVVDGDVDDAAIQMSWVFVVVALEVLHCYGTGSGSSHVPQQQTRFPAPAGIMGA